MNLAGLLPEILLMFLPAAAKEILCVTSPFYLLFFALCSAIQH